MSRNAGAVLFDLDDTLYPYRRFVLSGFAAVARAPGSARPVSIAAARSACFAWRGETHRGRELQACVEHFALPATIVPALIDVMRAHQPSMRLPRSSTRTLRALRRAVANRRRDQRHRRTIQARKVDALGVRRAGGHGRVRQPARHRAGEAGGGPVLGRARPAGRAARTGRCSSATTRSATLPVPPASACGRYCVRRLASAGGFSAARSDSCAMLWSELRWREVPRDGRIADEAFMNIGRHRIGRDAPLFVIAEIGLNHGGSLDRALAMVDAAAEAGVSAVKLQTVVAAELVRRRHRCATSLRPSSSTRRRTARSPRARARTAWRSSRRRSRRARVDLLERVGVDAYKIASGDLTWTRSSSAARARASRSSSRPGSPRSTRSAHALDAARRSGAGARRAAALRLGVSGAAGEREPARDRHARRGVRTCRSACPITRRTRSPCRSRSRSARRSTSGTWCSTGDDGAVDAAVSSTPAGFAERDSRRRATRSARLARARRRACRPKRQAWRAGAGSTPRARSRRGTSIAAADVIALRPATALAPGDLPALVGTRLSARRRGRRAVSHRRPRGGPWRCLTS